LWEFKDRILQSTKQVWNADVDLDLVICTLVLHAIYENVILTMTGINTGINAHSFINMAINWTLVHLQILDPSMLSEQERIMITEFELLDINGTYNNICFFIFLNITLLLIIPELKLFLT